MLTSQLRFGQFLNERAQNLTDEQIATFREKNFENYLASEVPSDLSMRVRAVGAKAVGYTVAGAASTFGIADSSTVMNCLTMIGLAGDDGAGSVESFDDQDHS